MKLVHGDDRLLDVVVRDAAGAALDISGGILRFTARTYAGDVVFAKSSDGSGVDILDEGSEPDRGKARITIEHDDWDDLAATARPRKLVWDLEYENEGGSLTTVAGTSLGDDPIEVLPEVTRAE